MKKLSGFLFALWVIAGFLYADTAPPPNNFLYSNPSVPSNPTTGRYKLYVKESDGKIYRLNSSGTSSDLGSLLGTSGSNTGDVTLGTANGLSLVGQALSLQAADSSHTGALTSTDWSTFNAKEPAITSSTTAKYWRGDKSFQDLNPAVIGSVLTGFTSGSGTVASTDTILQAINKLDGNVALKAPIASPTFTGTVTGTFSGSLTGNASTATKWETARSLAGNSVDGSADVTFSNKFIVQGTTDTGLSGAQFLGALGTGILKNTTTTGVLSIATAGDFPTLNQNTTGNAATATALAADPADCASDRYANAINASGTLTCAQVTNAGLAGSIAASKLIGSDIATVGTITSGTWNGTVVGTQYGGTGQNFSASTGLVKLSSGTASAASLVNADVSASAAIALSKLAAMGTSSIPYTDGSGFLVTTSAPAYDSTNKIATVTGDSSGFKAVSATDSTSALSMAYNQTNTRAEVKTLQTSTNAGAGLFIGTADVAGSNANSTGKVILGSGSKTAGTGSSGDVEINIGTSAGGTRGRFNVVDGTEGTAGMVWTSLNNTGGGHWMKPTADVNFINNPDAELNTAAWSTYADAAGVFPVDGTGGAPTVTWTRTTSSPLQGSGSFLFTKDAANRQGQGASYDFGTFTANRAKVIQIEFDYSVVSGTFVAGSSGVDSDIEVYIYDIGNGTLIQPTTYKLFCSSTSPPCHFISNFQTAGSGNGNYRLIFHVATTSASTYTVSFDNITVSPSRYTYGTAGSDTVTFTPTLSASTTPPTLGSGAVQQGSYRRSGDILEVWGVIVFGSSGTNAGSGTYRLPLPNNYTVDTVKLSQASARAYGGTASITSAGTAYDGVAVDVSGTNPNFMQLTKAGVIVTNASPGAWTANDVIKFHYTVPITGWNSTVQMSDSAPQAAVSMVSSVPTSGSITAAAWADVTGYSGVTDSTGSAFNSSTGVYTVQVPGWYTVSASAEIVGTGVSGAHEGIRIVVNGGAVSADTPVIPTVNTAMAYSASLAATYLNVGHTIKLQRYTDRTSATYTSANVAGTFSVSRIGDNRTIGATETTSLRYHGATATVTSSFSKLTYSTADFDDHALYSSGTATLKDPGKYHIDASTLLSCVSTASGNFYGIAVYINGNSYAEDYYTFTSTVVTGVDLVLSDDFIGKAGDTVEVRVVATCTTPTVASSSTRNKLGLFRIGL